VKIPSAGTPDFWRRYQSLPGPVRAVARKGYAMWREDAFHPSLHFKKIGGEKWSVRVGIHHRAIGRFVGDTLVWDWIGTHADYDRLAN
jgi:hypothetical protein